MMFWYSRGNREEIMRRIILACSLVGIFAMPAKGFDGTPSPNNPMPAIKAALDLLLCGYARCLAQDNPGGPAFGQRVDPLIGTWKLNLEKSTAFGFTLTESTTLTWSGEGQNFINTAEGVDAQGQSFKMIFRHIYDGQPHPTTGNPKWDATAYTRIGNTINIIRFRQGKTVSVERAVIVPQRDLYADYRRHRHQGSAISWR
jgi:hypothetical protein